MDHLVQQYIDALAAEQRPLFDRIHQLILTAHPEATVVLSYQIPTYRVGRRRLHIGAWKHGLSIYGWGSAHDTGFLDRHPQLKTGKGTIQLTPVAAALISDEELRDFFVAVLS